MMALGQAAGAARFVEVPPSPLSGVSPRAFAHFAEVLSLQGIADVSETGSIGSFLLSPRRLGEMGLMDNVTHKGSKWSGEFVAPDSLVAILKSPKRQYEIFCRSIRDYDDEIALFQESRGVLSRSGRLAVLHLGGRGALAKWPEHAFRRTKAAVERANNIF